jgi:hypothetical protein
VENLLFLFLNLLKSQMQTVIETHIKNKKKFVVLQKYFRENGLH